MRQFVAFQEFTPGERGHDGRCIWCGRQVPKNRAHIVSRKLTISSHASAVLRYSVCRECNTRCSEVEQWVLRYTPLGWVRFFLYFGANRRSDSARIPSYFYAENVGEWVVYSLQGCLSRREIPSQLILCAGGVVGMLTERPRSEHEREVGAIVSLLRDHRFRSVVKESLPGDFRPRALVEAGTALVIARNENDVRLLLEAVEKRRLGARAAEWVRLDPGADRQHFRWSRANWGKLCAKIAYEALCLFEGAAKCLRPEFEQVRRFVLSGASDDYRELTFDEHGPVSAGDVPLPVHLDLSVSQRCSRTSDAFLTYGDVGMHAVAVYENQGSICSSVSLAGFPPCVIVMADPGCHLEDLYQMLYDDEEDLFHFLRLAYDQNKPVIPLHVDGIVGSDIARTYGLKPIG